MSDLCTGHQKAPYSDLEVSPLEFQKKSQECLKVVRFSKTDKVCIIFIFFNSSISLQILQLI